MISDFAVFSAICVMVFVDVIVGLDTDKLQVPDKFEASRSLRPFEFHHVHNLISWWRGTVVERRSLAGELSLSCARPAADG